MAEITNAIKSAGGWTNVCFRSGAGIAIQQDRNGDIVYVYNHGGTKEEQKEAINLILRQREIAALEKIGQKK